MSEIAEGTAEAYDASVDTEAEVAAASREDELAQARHVVEAAEAKVEKQRQHLAGAEQSLATAQAALAEIEGA